MFFNEESSDHRKLDSYFGNEVVNIQQNGLINHVQQHKAPFFTWKLQEVQ